MRRCSNHKIVWLRSCRAQPKRRSSRSSQAGKSEDQKLLVTVSVDVVVVRLRGNVDVNCTRGRRAPQGKLHRLRRPPHVGRQAMPASLLPGLASAQFQGVDSAAVVLTAHVEMRVLEHHKPMVYKQGILFIISVNQPRHKQTITHGPVSVGLEPTHQDVDKSLCGFVLKHCADCLCSVPSAPGWNGPSSALSRSLGCLVPR